MKKKFLSGILTVIMVFSLMPLQDIGGEAMGAIRFPRIRRDVDINSSNFPDKVFRNYVKRFDKDHNGGLSMEERYNVDVIYHSAYAFYGEIIDSLEGIEYFPKIFKLNCEGNKIESLDLSKNTELKELYCYNNNLKSLDLSQNKKLNTLRCDGNQLGFITLGYDGIYEEGSNLEPQTVAYKAKRNDEYYKIYLSDLCPEKNKIGNVKAGKGTYDQDSGVVYLPVNNGGAGKIQYTYYTGKKTKKRFLPLQPFNMEVTVEWEAEANPCNVSFEGNGATGTMGKVGVSKGEVYTLPECRFVPPEGIKFKNWEIKGASKNPGEQVKITADTTVKAIWEKKTYTIRFDKNGGSGIAPEITMISGDNYTLPEVSFTPPEGMEFKNWEIKGTSKNPGEQVKITADTTVKAIWKKAEEKYLLSFNGNGGIGIMSAMEVVSGTPYILPPCGFNPAEGTTFKHWDINGVAYNPGQTYTVEGDTFIKAIWKKAEGNTDQMAQLSLVKEKLAKVRLRATTSYTKSKNVRVKIKVRKGYSEFKELKAMGCTIEYKFYRSRYKTKKFQKKAVKTKSRYYNTNGRKGRRYYYKARLIVRDPQGNYIASTKLSHCKYGSRVWKK